MKTLKNLETRSFATMVFTKVKTKKLFKQNEYNQLYPSGSAPARIYGIPKMYKFSSSDSFSKRRPIVLSIVTFNCNLILFL